MTALAGVAVKRIFSVLARQFAGLPGLKTHEAGSQNLCQFEDPGRIVRIDSHVSNMKSLAEIGYEKQSPVVLLRLQNNSRGASRGIAIILAKKRNSSKTFFCYVHDKFS